MPKKLTPAQKMHRRAVKVAKRWVKSDGGLKRLKGNRWTYK